MRVIFMRCVFGYLCTIIMKEVLIVNRGLERYIVAACPTAFLSKQTLHSLKGRSKRLPQYSHMIFGAK